MDASLYSRLCTLDTLRESWLKVKAKHSKGGIDFVSVENFDLHAEENLQEILAQLIAGTYVSMPMQKALAHKNDGTLRELGMLTVSDKIVQLAVKGIIEPVLEPMFSDVSYGFRPKKGPVKAIKRLVHIMNNENRRWIVAGDIENCFDSIPYDNVVAILHEKLNDPLLVDLIKGWLEMGRVTSKFRWDDSFTGLPQGGILSPLLTNLYLHSFDAAILTQHVGYIRYADDFVIGCKSEQIAKNLFGFARNQLTNNLKLKLNGKSGIFGPTDTFTFLGATVNNGHVFLSDEKANILKQRMDESFGIENHVPSRNFMQKLSGIKSYYGQIFSPVDNAKLDTLLVACLQKKLGDAYRNNLLPNKKSINDFVGLLHFFCNQNELLRKKIGFEIAQSCTKPCPVKREKKSSKISPNVKIRKRQFQKMEASGMELLISSPGMQIGISKGKIMVKKAGKVIKAMIGNNLKNITVTSDGISISTNLLRYCARNKIIIDFLNFDGTPFAKMVTPAFNEAGNEIAQIHALENSLGVKIAKSIIYGKIKNQINTLKFFSRQRKATAPDFMKKLPDACNRMKSCLGRLRNLQGNNLSETRGKIFAIEGQAATIYWEQLKVLLENNIDFPGRQHQGATDLINSMLNYGYALLYSRAWDAILSARLNPCVGYIHVAEKKRPALVYDFVEEFRSPLVDRTVVGLISKHEKMQVSHGLLTDFSKKRLTQKIFENFNKVEKFRNREVRVRDIIREQAVLLKSVLKGSRPIYKPYIKTW